MLACSLWSAHPGGRPAPERQPRAVELLSLVVRPKLACAFTQPQCMSPAVQVMVVVGDDEPQDNALKRFRREVMTAGKRREDGGAGESRMCCLLCIMRCLLCIMHELLVLGGS